MMVHCSEVKNKMSDCGEQTDQGHLLLKIIKTEKVEPIAEVETTFLNELEHPCMKEEEVDPDEFVNVPDESEEKSDSADLPNMQSRGPQQKRVYSLDRWSVAEESPFTCNFCGRPFSNRSKLNAHLIYHRGEKTLKCDQCGKWFGQKHSFQHHLRMHAGDRPYKCDKCGKTYVTKNELNQHVARVHPDEDVVKANCFTCGVCGEVFSLGAHLKTHNERTHFNETPYQCEHCKLVFRQSYALTRHVCRVTEEKKPFIGNVSDADVSRGGSVFTHKSTSYSGNPFECEICGKRFRQRSTLQKHAQNHREDHQPASVVTANHSTDGE